MNFFEEKIIEFFFDDIYNIGKKGCQVILEIFDSNLMRFYLNFS